MIYHHDMSLTSIQFAVLGMLKLRPMTGYEIKQAHQKGPANFMPISFGQIYPALAKLGKEKMVRQDKQPGSRGSIRYFITGKGEEALQEWLFSPRDPANDVGCDKAVQDECHGPYGSGESHGGVRHPSPAAAVTPKRPDTEQPQERSGQDHSVNEPP